MKKLTLFLILLLGIQLLTWLIPAPPFLKGIAGYLPLHTFLETIAISISILIFAVGWNSHSREVPGNIVLLSCVFFGVALIDFSHVLSYKGMPDFVTPSDPEKAINFWLAARYLSAIGLLLVTMQPWLPYRSTHTRYLIFTFIFLFSALVYTVFLFMPEVLPRTFIAGQGLTPFKVSAEYLLIGLSGITAILLWKQMKGPRIFHTPALFTAVCIMGMSEFFFTLYANVTDIFNLLGHVYKVIAYIFLYRALFIETIDMPYDRLKRVQQNLEISIQSAGIGLWEWNLKTNDVYFSPQWKAQLGYTDSELKNEFSTWECRLHPEDQQATLKYLNKFLSSQEQQYDSEFRLRHKDGSYRWIMAHGEKQTDIHGTNTYLRGSHIDITQRKLAEVKIHNLAFYDSLTQFPNRRLLMDRFTKAMQVSERTGKFGAILFLDLDRFKNINDTQGHAHGDQLLIEVANRIEKCVRKEDTISRLGGDEFVILLEDMDLEEAHSSRIAATIADKILRSVRQPFHIHNREEHTTTSIGIALFRGGEVSADEILRHADLAMYQAKSNGRNTIRFFDPDMQRSIEKHALIENELRSAIPRNQLILYYQVQVDQQNQSIGAEALIRWTHPTRGMISPQEFIPIAEESALIIDIGQWVLESACATLARWSDDPLLSQLRLSINVSAIQFQLPDFIEYIKESLNKYRFDHTKLKIELTEGTVLGDIFDVIRKMRALREMGIQLSMDDFGTGYSSLSYLTRLPLNQIKIDKSFVQNMLLDKNDAKMVQTIIQMTHNFEMEVIAEGVETIQQLSFLRENGCPTYQGYLFGKPMPAEEFENLISLRPWQNTVSIS